MTLPDIGLQEITMREHGVKGHADKSRRTNNARLGGPSRPVVPGLSMWFANMVFKLCHGRPASSA